MKRLKAATVQFNHLPGNKPANMEKIRAFVGRAVDAQVDILTFPEMCITGYWHIRNLSRDAIADYLDKRQRDIDARRQLQRFGEHEPQLIESCFYSSSH